MIHGFKLRFCLLIGQFICNVVLPCLQYIDTTKPKMSPQSLLNFRWFADLQNDSAFSFQQVQDYITYTLKGLNIFNFRIFKNLSCSQKPGRNRFSILVTDDYWSRYFGVKKINYKLFRCLGKKENVNTYLLLFVLSCFIVW